MPKVSVIIPVYGVEKYIERCARSLFEQTLDDIEFIFVNDCTKDRSIEILHRIVEEYPCRKHQIRIENMPTNSGQAAVRRHGIQLATGDYIIHCDSDDWVEISMYETLYKKGISENLDMVICDYCKTDGENHLHISCHSTCEQDKILSDFISQRVAVSLCNKLIKRNAYFDNKLIYPQNNMGEDFAIICQLATSCHKFGYINKALYYYYINPISICNQKSEEIKKKNWIGLHFNIQIIVNHIKKCKLLDNYKNDFKQLENQYRCQLLTYIENDRLCRTLWLKSYPNTSIFSEKGLKNKLRFLIIYLDLYKSYRFIYKLFKCSKTF